jgi:hypothetical protein
MSKPATITIYKKAVLASIDAQTFKRVDGVLSAESDQMKNALSSDSEENLDKHILHEHMENRDANLRRRLTFCLVSDDEDLSVSNLLEVDKPTFIYNLTVPDTFDKQRLKSLAKKIHNYMVQGSLYDWYATQNMKGNVSATELEDLESEIVSMLRPSSVKRPLQPFGPRY